MCNRGNDNLKFHKTLGAILKVIKRIWMGLSLVLLLFLLIDLYVNTDYTLGLVLVFSVMLLPTLTTAGLLTFAIWMLYRITEE